MATPVIMPKQGQSVETCIITRWFRNVGDKVAKGDILYAYETDKAAFELESPAEGTLLEIFFREGTEVPVLVNVAVIGQPGEATSAFVPVGIQPPAQKAKEVSHEPFPEKDKKSFEETYAFTPGDSRIKISPRAKNLAEASKLDYRTISGSGPHGRIVVSDIQSALGEGAAAHAGTKSITDEFTEKPVSNVRKLIARAMHSSLQNSAQLTHHLSSDARNLLKARQKIKEGLKGGTEKQDITLNDIICWCVIKALVKHPDANSHFLGETVKTFNKVHLGIAVDTSRGLMVPAVRNADEMTLARLSKELKQVAEACRKGSIDPELLRSTSASFTVSNLGNYGVEMFTPVINLPQVAILGVCTITTRPADLGNNTFGFVPYVGLSLTYDHRAIDGGPATLFLREIKEQIEGFTY